jgi:hypothetical protein
MSAPTQGRRRNGGLKVKERYGVEHFREICRKGGATTKSQRPDYAELGRKGGNATNERHGQAHYKRIGSLGGKQPKTRTHR